MNDPVPTLTQYAALSEKRRTDLAIWMRQSSMPEC